jgi:hypothetical protein
MGDGGELGDAKGKGGDRCRRRGRDRERLGWGLMRAGGDVGEVRGGVCVLVKGEGKATDVS